MASSAASWGLIRPTAPGCPSCGRCPGSSPFEAERYARPSDFTDLLMAATVGPYVDVLATDRYVREIMQRIGYEGQVYSGRRHEVLRLVAMLKRDHELG